MEDRRADADARGGDQDHEKRRGKGKQHKPGQREPMPTASEYGFGALS
jgi:hypothetical protein